MPKRVQVLRLWDKAPTAADLVVNVTSRDARGKELSPFFLGPVQAGRIEFYNFENLWQYSKVYPSLGHLGTDGLPSEVWHDWFAGGAKRRRAERYPAGKGAVPAYTWSRGRCWSYTSARKLIYIPEYAKLAAETKLFRKLQEAYDDGAHIVLQDFDAYDHLALHYSWEQVMNDATRKMGHGFVIAMMLERGPDFYRTILL